MKSTANLIYFSPTKTTNKVVEAIVMGIGSAETKHFDLTLPSSDNRQTTQIEKGVSIFGVPVYSGRVPVEAVRRLKNIRGDNTPAIIVVVYGNRDYEDALIELSDLVIEQGFRPFAAAAFIGEHSYSTPEKPIAQSRPDADDLQLANTFGKKIGEILNNDFRANTINHLPGNVPYKTLSDRTAMSPFTIEEECTKCGICVSVCPTGAIEMNEVMETDSVLCIMCCACVKECPTNARVNNNDFVKAISQRLFENCSVRKEPEMFF